MSSENVYLTDQIYTDTINIHSHELNRSNLNNIVLKKLKIKNEGKCNNFGYILNNSIKFISKSLGKLKDNKIVYSVKYKAHILSPSNDNIIECYIESINKMGILAYIKISDILEDSKDAENNMSDSPFIIIIPENSIDNINNYNVKQKIKIVVKASRTKYKSDKIQIIGNIV